MSFLTFGFWARLDDPPPGFLPRSFWVTFRLVFLRLVGLDLRAVMTFLLAGAVPRVADWLSRYAAAMSSKKRLC